MAKGNIGNLLQHFVALRVAKRVVEEWNRPEEAIEYIECYSMAPWEPITGRQPQSFVKLVNKFGGKRDQGDFVASVFLEAWQHHYGLNPVPDHPQEREYPNTAVLLRTAFPGQAWRMRLHEDDSTKEGKYRDLCQWAANQNNGQFDVRGKWNDSDLILGCPAPLDKPVLIMLDPFQIVSNQNQNAGLAGYLSEQGLRFLAGNLGLVIQNRPNVENSASLVLTMFTYSDANPEVANGIIREFFNDNQWSVEVVSSGSHQGRNGQNRHVGWIVSTGLEEKILGASAQDLWDAWIQH